LNSASDPEAENKFQFLKRGTGLGKNFKNKDEPHGVYQDDFAEISN
jgi:hypothetical protein